MQCLSDIHFHPSTGCLIGWRAGWQLHWLANPSLPWLPVQRRLGARAGHLTSYLAGEVIPPSPSPFLPLTHACHAACCLPKQAVYFYPLLSLPHTVWCKQPALKSPETAARFLSFSSPGSKTSPTPTSVLRRYALQATNLDETHLKI